MAKRTEFTPAKAPCVLLTIEAVFPDENRREMEDLLDQLRSFGAAVVVKRQQIAEGFEEAAEILDRRKLRQ